jgi:hypothetical protein
MKQTVVPTTKKLLGTLALIGLMSVVLAKFFSDLAFADELPVSTALVADAQFVGEFEIKTVVGNTELGPKGNLCAQEDPAGSHLIDPRCNQKVLVYRSSDGSFVFLNVENVDGQADPNIIKKGGTIGKIEPIVDGDKTITLTPVVTE